MKSFVLNERYTLLVCRDGNYILEHDECRLQRVDLRMSAQRIHSCEYYSESDCVYLLHWSQDYSRTQASRFVVSEALAGSLKTTDVKLPDDFSLDNRYPKMCIDRKKRQLVMVRCTEVASSFLVWKLTRTGE